ncbi:MAG: hypothetical protein AB1640_18750 [bacterium]
MPDRQWAAFLPLLAIATALAGCGGGSVLEVSVGKEGETIIGSPLPSNIQISRVQGLNRFAFVITTAPPLGIFRYDLNASAPYPFVYLDLFGKIGGVPDELVLVDEDQGLFTTSGGFAGQGEGVHLFDPTPPAPEDFALQASVPVFRVALDPARTDSAGNLVSVIDPSYTSGAAVVGGKLYVCTSNFTAVGGNPVCPPGTVLVYRWDSSRDPPSIAPSDPPHLVTTAFNPTEVTALDDRIVLVTNSGVLAIREARAVPLTEASVDVIDTALDCVVGTYPLGLTALSYKAVGITPDRTRALVGSVAFNAVYELDLTVLADRPESCPDPIPRLDGAVLAGPEDPILIGSSGAAGARTADFVVQVVLSEDGTRAYATGYNSGTLSVLDVELEPGRPSPKMPALVLALTPALDPEDPTQKDVGPGPLAVRPGTPGTDFSGPDLFVLIGLPTGKMFGVKTY